MELPGRSCYQLQVKQKSGRNYHFLREGDELGFLGIIVSDASLWMFFKIVHLGTGISFEKCGD